jgi:hypothetical protein
VASMSTTLKFGEKKILLSDKEYSIPELIKAQLETEVSEKLKSIESNFEITLDTCRENLTTMFEDNEGADLDSEKEDELNDLKEEIEDELNDEASDYPDEDFNFNERYEEEFSEKSAKIEDEFETKRKDELEQYLDESLETEIIDDILNEHAPLLAILKSQDLELYNKFLTAVENMLYIDSAFRNYGPCKLVLLNKLMNFKKHYTLPILDMGPEILTEVKKNFYIFNVKDTFVELLALVKLLDDKYQITQDNLSDHLKTIDCILEKELHNFPLLEISSATYKSERHTD